MTGKGRTAGRLSWSVALLSVLGCAGADVGQADRQGLDELRSAYLAAYNAGDIEAMAEVYTPEAVRMPYDAPIQNGREAILDAYRQSFGSRRFTPTLTFTADRVRILGEIAIERGSYREELRAAGGGQGLLENGKYVVIARSDDDGTWRYETSIFNRDGRPLPLD